MIFFYFSLIFIFTFLCIIYFFRYTRVYVYHIFISTLCYIIFFYRLRIFHHYVYFTFYLHHLFISTLRYIFSYCPLCSLYQPLLPVVLFFFFITTDISQFNGHDLIISNEDVYGRNSNSTDRLLTTSRSKIKKLDSLIKPQKAHLFRKQ